MSPAAFEDLVFALVRDRHDNARQMKAPDAGRDTVVPADASHGEWAWQAKHHTSGIDWNDCHKSIATAYTLRRPERLTFVFPVNMTAGKEQGLRRLRDEYGPLGLELAEPWTLGTLREMLLARPGLRKIHIDPIVGHERAATVTPRIFTFRHRPKTRAFAGREADLARVEEAFERSPHAGSATPLAVTGLGGVGKTQLALEYASRHRSDYEIVFVLRADQAATLHSDFGALAEALGLHLPAETELIDLAGAVASRLDATEWLLIFDDADDPNLLAPLLPQSERGHVLITSRVASWFGAAKSIDLDVFSRTDAVDYLVAGTGRDDERAAGELAHALGYLPLAITQAIGYMLDSKAGFGEYLERLKHAGLEVFDEEHPRDYEHTVLTVWRVSLERLSRTPDAVILLEQLAFMAPDPLPRSVLMAPFADNTASADRERGALARLVSLSLVQADEDTVSWS